MSPKVATMKTSYDFSGATRNPYANRLKKQITIRIDVGVLDYFKELSQELGIPYQTLINLHLRDCSSSRKRPTLDWVAESDLASSDYTGEQSAPPDAKSASRPRRQ